MRTVRSEAGSAAISSGGGFVPVLLLPGWKDRARALRHLVRGLIANGWPALFVTAIEFKDPFGGNAAHATEIGFAIDRLRERTGVPAVDVIAHSMGGLALRCFLDRVARTEDPRPGRGLDLERNSRPDLALVDSIRTARPLPVRRAVFLATPHYGTWMAWLAWGDGGREMRPGSAFLHRLPAAQLPESIHACCVRTRIDSHVIPGSSAVLPDVHTHVLGSVTHRGMLRSQRVLRLIIQHLRSE
ncbi:MAG: esterase/lipase family protein [Longimicrobiales bacterium]